MNPVLAGTSGGSSFPTFRTQLQAGRQSFLPSLAQAWGHTHTGTSAAEPSHSLETVLRLHFSAAVDLHSKIGAQLPFTGGP